MVGNYLATKIAKISSIPPLPPINSAWSEVEKPLLLDLYCSEKLKVAPNGLSLRKVWTGYDPYVPTPRRGYYVVRPHGQRLRCMHFGLTSYERALACFQSVRAHQCRCATHRL